jgi:tetratricopeptide (TPR) repeat protein
MSAYTPHEAIIYDVAQLPVQHPGKLIGRETVLAQVYTQLKEGQPVLIYGASANGKTALAATLATAYAQQSGGVLWLSVDNPRLEELLVRVGRAYNISEITASDTPIDRIASIENILRENRPFIVMDGAIDAGVLSRFISRCAEGLPLLATSEIPLNGLWANVAVPPLESEQAAALYKREGRVAINEYDDDVFEIIDIIGRSPLAVIIAGRAMVASKHTPDNFLKLLSQISTSTGSQGTTLAITASFRALNGALQGLMLMMGAMFPNGASTELVSRVSGAAEESVEQAMTILAQLNLIGRTTRYGGHHYHMHPAVYQFANQSLERAGKLAGLRRKAHDTIIAYANQHSQAHNADKLAGEMDTFIGLANWSIRNNDRQTALELASTLQSAGDFVAERGYHYEVGHMRDDGNQPFPAHSQENRPLIPVFDDEAEEDSQMAVAVPNPASNLFQTLDDIKDDVEEFFDDDLDEDDDEPDTVIAPEDRPASPTAFLERFLEDDDEDQDTDASNIFQTLDDIKDDVEEFFDDDDEEEEPDSVVTSDDRPVLPPAFLERFLEDEDDQDTEDHVPSVFKSPEDHILLFDDDASAGETDIEPLIPDEHPLSFLQAFSKPEADSQNLFADDDLDDDEEEALSFPEDISEEVVIPTRLEDMDEAQLRVNLAEVRQAGDTDKQIEILKILADRQVKDHSENEAITTYNEILTVYEAIDDEEGILDMLDMLSALMVKTENPQPAIMHASRGVRLAQDQGDDVTLTQLYITLGDARQALGESGQAIADYESALKVTRDNDDTQHEAIVLYKLGYAQLDDGDAELSVDTLEQALALFKTQGKRDYEGRVMGALGSALSDLARWSEAMRFHTSALYIAREVHDRDEEALQLMSLAYAAVQAGELGDAVLRYRQALYLAFIADDADNIISIIVDLARLLLRSRSYANIANMLIQTAEVYEAHDRDVLQLRAQVDEIIANAQATGTTFKQTDGNARQYAQNAYQLLDD